MLALISAAFASDLSTSLWHPGAEPMARGFGYAGTGALVSIGDGYAGTWLSVTGAWAPSRRLAVSGTALGAVGSGLVAGGVRFNVVDSPWFHVAPVAYGAMFAHEEDVTSESAGAGLGLAVEAGWTRVRFDTFVPVLKTGASEGPIEPQKRLPGFGRFDVGVTVRVGADEHHRLRTGVDGERVSFAYQYVGAHWFLDTTLAGGAPGVSTWARGGFTF